MARIPLATREDVPEGQLEAFDQMVTLFGSVPKDGPASILAHVPKARKLEKDLNDYLRYESSLPKDVVELTILVTARELDCQFVWNSHAPAARKAGIKNEVVDALRDRKDIPPVSELYTAVISYGREFFRTHRVSRGSFQTALEQLGRRGVIELSLLFGNYSMLAVVLNSFDADLRPNRTEPVLPV